MTEKGLYGNNLLNKMHFQDNTSFNAQTRGKRAVVTCLIHKNEQYLNDVSMDDFFTRMAMMNRDKMIFSSSRKILLSFSASHQPLKLLLQKVKVLLKSPFIAKENFFEFGVLDFANRKNGVKYSNLNQYNK